MRRDLGCGGIIDAGPDQVSDDACLQQGGADNRSGNSGIEGAADDVLDLCFLQVHTPVRQQSCLGGDFGLDSLSLCDGPKSRIESGGGNGNSRRPGQMLVKTGGDEVGDYRILECDGMQRIGNDGGSENSLNVEVDGSSCPLNLRVSDQTQLGLHEGLQLVMIDQEDTLLGHLGGDARCQSYRVS